MSTYITMIERIENEIDDTSLREEVKLAIQSAITHHARKQFWFNRVQFDFPVVANDEYFDSTDDAEIPNIVKIDSAWLLSGGIRYPITQVEDTDIASAQTGSVIDRPTNFSYVRKSLRVYPIADASYTFYAEAWSRLTTLSADGDTNAWMTDGEELIRQRAKYILAIDVIGDEAMALRAKGAENEALAELELENIRRRGRQFLRVDPALIGSAPYDINAG